MKTISALLALGAAFALPTAAMAKEGDASPVTVSFSLTGATDYVWRGVSQSNEDPAVFATAQVNYGGFYAGAGTENVDFAGVKQEYDLWGGYVFDLGGAKLDLGVVRYGYVDAGANIDTLEGKIGLSGTVGKLGLGATAYHTGNYFGTSEPATYVEANAAYPLTDKLSASGAFGHQQIDNLPDYNTWNLGLSYEVLKGAKVDVRYHDTDTNAFGTLGDSRVVGSFTVGF
ncbi:TorF family putative porin [Novosphingobium sp.]|uniref:TorF family putative porin n=1 Tax=Novosphingobium sp. TaxID=1874826 RepID=UPI0035B2F87B